MNDTTALTTYRNSDLKVTYTFPRGYDLGGFSAAFYFRASAGATPLLTVTGTPTVNGSSATIVGASVVLILKKADLQTLPSEDVWVGVYDSTLTKDGFVNRFAGGALTQYIDGSYGEQEFSDNVFVEIDGQQNPVVIVGGNIAIGASILLADLNAAVEQAAVSANSAMASEVASAAYASQAQASASFLAPGVGASAVPTSTYLRNRLLMTSYGGLLGTVSANPVTNALAFDQLVEAATDLGRTAVELPYGEIPISPGRVNSTSSLAIYGSGETETLLNFGAASTDGLTLDGSANQTLGGIGFIASGATGGSLVKVTGTNKPVLSHLGFLGGYNFLEFTGGTGGAEVSAIKGSGYTNFGIYLHDDVQGLNWRGGNLNAGSLTAGIGLKCEGFVSAIRVAQVEILTGLRSIYATAASVGDASCFSYSEFDEVYCDGPAQASIIENSRDITWTGGWFSGGRELVAASYDHGLSLMGNQNVIFSGTRFKNCGKNGVQHVATNTGVQFLGCSATNNGNMVANSRGFSFESGSQNFAVIGGLSNNTSYSSGQQAYGVVLDTCSNASVIGHRATGTVTGILNTTPGSNLYITSCPGTANYP